MKFWGLSRAVIAAAIVLGGSSGALASDWSQKVASLIAAQHSYPRSAQIRGDEGTAKIRISIDGNGNISNVELIEPTGSDILDREALRIPTKIGTVPPPPGGKPAALVVPISWKLT